MEKIRSILNEFESISLNEMDKVALLDRLDTKFVFRAEMLPNVFEKMKIYYRVLDINGTRLNKYETLYYDTPDLELYLKHYYGRVNRYKVRFRKYVGSALSYFEIKFKNNKGRTLKSRVKRPDIEQTIQGKSEKLLKEKTHYQPHNLSPVLWNNFYRITFVSKTAPERLTIDLDLQFKNDARSVDLPRLIIAELKHNRSLVPSAFISIMKQCKIKQDSISKYCLGVLTLFKNIKRNNFKRNLTTINKICYENAAQFI